MMIATAISQLRRLVRPAKKVSSCRAMPPTLDFFRKIVAEEEDAAMAVSRLVDAVWDKVSATPGLHFVCMCNESGTYAPRLVQLSVAHFRAVDLEAECAFRSVVAMMARSIVGAEGVSGRYVIYTDLGARFMYMDAEAWTFRFRNGGGGGEEVQVTDVDAIASLVRATRRHAGVGAYACAVQDW
jgi:hypothetical protein